MIRIETPSAHRREEPRRARRPRRLVLTTTIALATMLGALGGGCHIQCPPVVPGANDAGSASADAGQSLVAPEAGTALTAACTCLPAGGGIWEAQGTALEGVGFSSCDKNEPGPPAPVRSFRLDSMTTSAGEPVVGAHVDQGRLAGAVSGKPLHETEFVGVQLDATLKCLDSKNVVPVKARITHVEKAAAEVPSTYIYSIEVLDPGKTQWFDACPKGAIPIAGVFSDDGALHDTSDTFTFACRTAVAAKCYSWGYRPWDVSPAHPHDAGLMKQLYWSCTRMARADYLGNGTPATLDNTIINVWDSAGVLPHGAAQTPPPLPRCIPTLEAVWNTSGAVCANHRRWIDLPEPGSAFPPQCSETQGQGAVTTNERVLYDESFVHEAKDNPYPQCKPNP